MNDRKRSPNYPSASLEDSILDIKKFYSAERRTAVDAVTAAKSIGYSSLSGAARVKLAALKQYGLLTGRGDKLSISDLGLRIVLPADDVEFGEAVKEAALNPDLFRQLQETHAEASTNAVVSYLVREMGFVEDSARRLDRAFRETMRFANVDAAGYNRTEATPAPLEEVPVEKAPVLFAPSPQVAPRGGNSLVLSVPYLGGALSVQISVAPGERLTQKLVEKVIRFLTLAKEDLPEENSGERREND